MIFRATTLLKWFMKKDRVTHRNHLSKTIGELTNTSQRVLATVSCQICRSCQMRMVIKLQFVTHVYSTYIALSVDRAVWSTLSTLSNQSYTVTLVWDPLPCFPTRKIYQVHIITYCVIMLEFYSITWRVMLK